MSRLLLRIHDNGVLYLIWVLLFFFLCALGIHTKNWFGILFNGFMAAFYLVRLVQLRVKKPFKLPDLRGCFIRGNPTAAPNQCSTCGYDSRLIENEIGDWHCSECGKLVLMKPDGRTIKWTVRKV